MNRRDLFIAVALNGILSNQASYARTDEVVKRAVEIADQLMLLVQEANDDGPDTKTIKPARPSRSAG